jgi:hypothetical protein
MTTRTKEAEAAAAAAAMAEAAAKSKAFTGDNDFGKAAARHAVFHVPGGRHAASNFTEQLRATLSTTPACSTVNFDADGTIVERPYDEELSEETVRDFALSRSAPHTSTIRTKVHSRSGRAAHGATGVHVPDAYRLALNTNFLSQFVRNGWTPHVLQWFGKHTTPANKERHAGWSICKTTSRVGPAPVDLLSGYEVYEEQPSDPTVTLAEWLDRNFEQGPRTGLDMLADSDRGIKLQSILFQVVWTLYQFGHVYTVHNNLTLDNILVMELPPDNRTRDMEAFYLCDPDLSETDERHKMMYFRVPRHVFVFLRGFEHAYTQGGPINATDVDASSMTDAATHFFNGAKFADGDLDALDVNPVVPHLLQPKAPGAKYDDNLCRTHGVCNVFYPHADINRLLTDLGSFQSVREMAEKMWKIVNPGDGTTQVPFPSGTSTAKRFLNTICTTSQTQTKGTVECADYLTTASNVRCMWDLLRHSDVFRHFRRFHNIQEPTMIDEHKLPIYVVTKVGTYAVPPQPTAAIPHFPVSTPLYVPYWFVYKDAGTNAAAWQRVIEKNYATINGVVGNALVAEKLAGQKRKAADGIDASANVSASTSADASNNANTTSSTA